MIFLVGRHAMFGHAPPTYFLSIEAVRLPSRATVHGFSFPPVPAPSTRTSYFSAFPAVITASRELAVERVRSWIPVRDDSFIGATRLGTAILIGSRLTHRQRHSISIRMHVRLTRPPGPVRDFLQSQPEIFLPSGDTADFPIPARLAAGRARQTDVQCPGIRRRHDMQYGQQRRVDHSQSELLPWELRWLMLQALCLDLRA